MRWPQAVVSGCEWVSVKCAAHVLLKRKPCPAQEQRICYSLSPHCLLVLPFCEGSTGAAHRTLAAPRSKPDSPHRDEDGLWSVCVGMWRRYGTRFATASADGSIATWRLDEGALGAAAHGPTELHQCFDSRAFDLVPISHTTRCVVSMAVGTLGLDSADKTAVAATLTHNGVGWAHRVED
jgi:hypothetical protein